MTVASDFEMNMSLFVAYIDILTNAQVAAYRDLAKAAGVKVGEWRRAALLPLLRKGNAQ
jgi:hypothetical protein